MQDSGFNIFTDLQSIAPESKCTKPSGKKSKHAALGLGPRLTQLKSKNVGSTVRNPLKRALGDVSNKINDAGVHPPSNSKKEVKKVPAQKCTPQSKAPAPKKVVVEETENLIHDVRNETFLPIEIFPDIVEEDDSWDVLPSDHRLTVEDIYRIVNLRECNKENYSDDLLASKSEAPLSTIEVPFFDDIQPFVQDQGDDDAEVNSLSMPFLPDFPVDEEGFVCHYIRKSFE